MHTYAWLHVMCEHTRYWLVVTNLWTNLCWTGFATQCH